MTPMQILVVGGGIVGMASAARLAEHGHLVQLLERERPGQRASWVAAGLLTPSSPWKYPAPLIDLARRSEALYLEFVRELREHTGLDAEYENAGMIYPAGVGASAEQLETATRRRLELGFGVERWERARLDAEVPGLGPEIVGAAWQPHGARVRPPRLMAALRRRLEQLEVSVASECEVVALVERGGRVVGARLANGQQLEADAVVLAAGAWSSPLAASVGVRIDVRPVRGQILLLRGRPGALRPTINDGDAYLVPRADGRILVGSTMEDAGYDAVNTEEALVALRRQAARLFPECARMQEQTSWAGLRPGTPDRLPYLGSVPGLPGLVLATGHFRNGILLAPITARLVAEVIEGRAPSVELAPFAPRAVASDAALLP